MPDDQRPWDKTPRTRRRDEDDADDRRRDRREREGEEDGDYDEDYEERRLRRAMKRERLLAIAFAQHGIIACILFYFGLVAAYFGVPPQFQLWVALGLIPVGLTAAAFVFLLTARVYSSTTAIVLGILELVPGVGLFVLLAVNQRATTILTNAGVRVGFFGARTSDIR